MSSHDMSASSRFSDLCSFLEDQTGQIKDTAVLIFRRNLLQACCCRPGWEMKWQELLTKSPAGARSYRPDGFGQIAPAHAHMPCTCQMSSQSQ